MVEAVVRLARLPPTGRIAVRLPEWEPVKFCLGRVGEACGTELSIMWCVMGERGEPGSAVDVWCRSGLFVSSSLSTPPPPLDELSLQSFHMRGCWDLRKGCCGPITDPGRHTRIQPIACKEASELMSFTGLRRGAG